MPSDGRAQNTVLEQLNNVITDTASIIQLFVKDPLRDFTRNRKLGAETFIKVALNMQGNSLNAELLNAFPNPNERMTASAYEQQKDKILPELFEYILREFNETHLHPKRMNGYRLYAIDGSDFNLPYSKDSPYAQTPAKKKSKNKDGTFPKDPKPFCMFHANILYDIENRTYQDCIIAEDERSSALTLVKRMNETEPFIVVMDRGYEGFNNFETLNRIPNCHFVIRTKTGTGGIREIAELPDKEIDTEIEFTIVTTAKQFRLNENAHMINVHEGRYKEVLSPKTRYGKWDFESPCKVRYRVVKFKINDEESGKECWEVLVTNLNRFRFPINEMKKLYHKRWDIETSFRELKYALGAIQFHSKKPEFQYMELLANMIMFNAVSRSIACVSIKEKERKWDYAIDFKMAVLLTRLYFRIDCHAPPGKLYEELAMYINPVRLGRSNKRNLRPKSAVWFLYRVA